MEFKELESKIVKWAAERNFFSERGSDALSQCKKLNEEFNELYTAISNNELEKIADGLGDMLVVMIIIAEYKNMSLTACLEIAYNEIKDRKGKMVSGLFVKNA